MSLWDSLGNITGLNQSSSAPSAPPTQKSTDWGGTANGAQQAVQRYQGMGADASQRQGVQINYGNANQDRSDAAQARQMQQGAYGQQQNAANMYQNMANGQGPSLASSLMGQGMDKIVAGQASAAASARGPAGLAMAQQNAAANTANQQQQLNSNLGAMRSQEQLNAMGGYANQTNNLQNAASGIRTSDYAGQTQDASQAEAQALSDRTQRQLNQDAQTGYERDASDVNKSQLVANQGANGTSASTYGSQLSADDSAEGRGLNFVQGAISKGASALSMLSDMRMKQDVLPANAGPVVDQDGQAGAVDVAPWDNSDAHAAYDARNSRALSKVGGFFTTLAGGNPGTAAPTSGAGGALASISDMRMKSGASPAGMLAAADAIGRSQSAMYGSPAAVGASDRASLARAADLQSQIDATYGAPVAVAQTQARDASAPARMLDELQPYAYRYTPESGQDPTKQRYGIMAQDLERSPMGSSLVIDTPKGKAIDVPQATGANLAAAADLHQRVKALEDAGAMSARDRASLGAVDAIGRSQSAMYAAPSAVRRM